MIELNDVMFAYGTGGFELKAPSLSIGKSEAVAVIGPSGSGKTTLLNLIAGILQPTQGTVRINGQDHSSLNDQARRKRRLTEMGMVFQGIELIDYLSARDNALLPYRLNAALTLDSTVRQRADHLLDHMGLKDKASRRASTLSQGERQRVGICRALLTKPSVILADEPTASLDETSTANAMDLLLQLARDINATVMMLTHDKALLPRFDRVVAIEHGTASERRTP